MPVNPKRSRQHRPPIRAVDANPDTTHLRPGLRADHPHATDAQTALTEFKHVGRPNLPDRDILFERFHDILDRAWLTNDGSYVRAFETRIAEICRVRNCVAVSNGTLALMVAAQCLGLTGEVIMPSLTFVATPHAFAWQGLQPVFADVNSNSCCIDPDHVESLITPRTSAIVGVHLWGNPCDVRRLESIAQRHGLKLLFDASHAFACTAERRPVGNFGDAETFSFHATKFVSSVEGGAVVTNNDDLAARLRRARNFGFSGVDCVTQLGINAKLNEFSAAFGLTSLETVDTLTQRNRENYECYAVQLRDIPGLSLLPCGQREISNFQYVVIRVDETECGLHRDELMAVLHQNNVGARRYFYPGCHRAAPYALQQHHALPVTEKIVGEVLTLPTGTAVTRGDVETICGLLRATVRSARRAA